MGREGGTRKAQEILNIKSEWIQDVSCFFDRKKSLTILSRLVMIIDLSELISMIMKLLDKNQFHEVIAKVLPSRTNFNGSGYYHLKEKA